MRKLLLDEIKAIEVQILDEVHSFCKANSIPYFLTGGTLIGAVRHNGFIPWDDDIDIVMYRDDYDRFVDLFNKSQSRYKAYTMANTKAYYYHFSKVCDMETLLIEDNIEVSKTPLGVNIDLFPMDKLPSDVDAEKLYRKQKRIDQIKYGKTFRWNKLRYKPVKQQLLILAYKLLGLPFSTASLAAKTEAIARKYESSDTTRYSFITPPVHKFPILDRKVAEPVEHCFEGRQYWIPNCFDAYLTTQFGDYMTPPPKEQQVAHHAFTAWVKE